MIDYTDVEKKVYTDNRDTNILELENILKEIDGNEPNQFLLHALFCKINEQTNFLEHIIKNGHNFADKKKEKYILEVFIAKSKEKFGAKNYDELLIKWNKEREKSEE